MSENSRSTIDSLRRFPIFSCENRTSNWIFGSREDRARRGGELVVWREKTFRELIVVVQDDFGSQLRFGRNSGTELNDDWNSVSACPGRSVINLHC